ncbi:MAG: sugar phosphate isomerase/epimerase family protein [Phycisphaerae bacterium]
MDSGRVGVDLQDLGLPPKAGLRRASAMGFRAVQFPAVAGELSARTLSISGRRHVKRFAAGLGLDIAALVADFPSMRLTQPNSIDQRVNQTIEVIEMAASMAVPVVVTSLGAVTDAESGAVVPVAGEALGRLAEASDARNATLALKPAFDAGGRLVNVLNAIACLAVGVCLDPAEMVMRGCNPLDRFDDWAARVALVHVRDATAGEPGRVGRETSLGEGEVDIRGMIVALRDCEYRGDFILRRAEATSPATELSESLTTFRSMQSNL